MNKEKVLIVEDNSIAMALIKKSFEGFEDKFELFYAVDIKSAKIIIERETVDLVMSDWKLPDGEGFDLIPPKEPISYGIAFTTAYGDEKLAVDAIKKGAIDYIAKSEKVYKEFPRLCMIALEQWKRIVAKRKAEATIQEMNKTLESKVEERTFRLIEEISKQKQIEQELKEAKVRLSELLEEEKKLSEMKSNIINTVSHQYRTPMTVILSSTYVMEKLFDLGLKKEFSEQLNKIQLSIEEMTAIMENVLFIDKAEPRNYPMVDDHVDYIDFWKTIIEEFQINDKFEKEFKLVCVDEDFQVRTNRKALYKIASNIVSNAVLFSPEGSKIRISCFEEDFRAIVEISDNGIGIHPDDLPDIFDSFFRGRNVGAIPGTGLGLTIVKRAVDLLGGEINIESELDKGTKVFLKLPKKPL